MGQFVSPNVFEATSSKALQALPSVANRCHEK
jgi:hypothetical protein